MKKLFTLFAMLIFTLSISAQNQGSKRFDPKQFEADLEQHIVTQAGLSPSESSAFFPLFKEMMAKQRLLFNKMRTYRHVDTKDDAACRKAIKEMDAIDIEIKELQQTYHQRFCKVLPAGKVLKVIRAEEQFHRQQMKRMAGPKKNNNNQPRK